MRQNDGETPAWMKSMLFDKLPHRFESHPEEIYAKANLFAKKYCSVIEHNFILRQDMDGLLKDVRRLYSYNERNKLNHMHVLVLSIKDTLKQPTNTVKLHLSYYLFYIAKA